MASDRKSSMSGWVRGELSGHQRRRLMAVLRCAHRVLGLGSKCLGIGGLGVGVVSVGLSGMPAFAAGGLFINDGTDGACYKIQDGGLPASSYIGPECNANPATQTTTSMFYGPTGTPGTANNASKSLSLGGELWVNAGKLGLSDVLGNGSMRIGNSTTLSTAAGVNSVVIGANASAPNDNSVALGPGSLTTNATPTASATIGTLTFSGFAGATPGGSVSIGGPSLFRQLQNVAAGQVTATSTDAINGSQLYSVASTTQVQIGSLSTGVLSLSTGLNTTNSTVASLSTSTSTGLTSVSTGLSTTNSTVASLSTSTATGLTSLSTGLSTTNSNVTSLSTSASTGIASVSTGVSSLSTGLSSTNSTVANLSSGLSSTNSNLTSLSTSTSTGIASVSTGVSSLSTGVASLSTGLSTTNSNVTLDLLRKSGELFFYLCGHSFELGWTEITK